MQEGRQRQGRAGAKREALGITVATYSIGATWPSNSHNVPSDGNATSKFRKGIVLDKVAEESLSLVLAKRA